MKLIHVLWMFFFLSVNLKAQDPGNELKYINGMDISSGLLSEIESKVRVSHRPMWFYFYVDSIIDTTDYSYTDSFSHGLVFGPVAENIANPILEQYRSILAGLNLGMFLTNSSNKGSSIQYDLCIIKASDKFEGIRKMGTAGPDMDIKTDDIIEVLKKWDEEFGIQINIIESNSLTLSFNKLPSDLNAFGQFLQTFCYLPMDEVYGGDLKNFEKEFQKTQTLNLYW
ncbi:MAG: DUF4253 domain-containing protein [Flavobacteriales bacterium]|nr:DUF4253 domain-containing protein [Flavobacteriales bacterium]